MRVALRAPCSPARRSWSWNATAFFPWRHRPKRLSRSPSPNSGDRDASRPANRSNRQGRPADRTAPVARVSLPPFSVTIFGGRPVCVSNPNPCFVSVGIRAGKYGTNFQVAPNSTNTERIPDGTYDIYFIYSNKPSALIQGDSFTLQGNGMQYFACSRRSVPIPVIETLPVAPTVPFARGVPAIESRKSPASLPPYSVSLFGSSPVCVSNPNRCFVSVGIRAGGTWNQLQLRRTAPIRYESRMGRTRSSSSIRTSQTRSSKGIRSP